MGISKALLGLPGNHHSILQETGLLVRDPRAVERKKPGQKKARKKFTWSVNNDIIMTSSSNIIVIYTG